MLKIYPRVASCLSFLFLLLSVPGTLAKSPIEPHTQPEPKRPADPSVPPSVMEERESVRPTSEAVLTSAKNSLSFFLFPPPLQWPDHKRRGQGIPPYPYDLRRSCSWAKFVSISQNNFAAYNSFFATFFYLKNFPECNSSLTAAWQAHGPTTATSSSPSYLPSLSFLSLYLFLFATSGAAASERGLTDSLPLQVPFPQGFAPGRPRLALGSHAKKGEGREGDFFFFFFAPRGQFALLRIPIGGNGVAGWGE